MRCSPRERCRKQNCCANARLTQMGRSVKHGRRHDDDELNRGASRSSEATPASAWVRPPRPSRRLAELPCASRWATTRKLAWSVGEDPATKGEPCIHKDVSTHQNVSTSHCEGNSRAMRPSWQEVLASTHAETKAIWPKGLNNRGRGGPVRATRGWIL